jgi:hypothetical protein
MSDDQAYKRIRAARAVRRFPVIGTAVADGRLHLGGVLLLAAHLSQDNAEELVAEARGKSKAAIEVLLARRAPKPDVPPRLEPVAQQMELAPGPAGQEKAAKVTPLAPERFALQLTISGATQAKLVRAQALLRHQVPSGDLAEVVDRALDELLAKVEARKLGKATRPRAAKASRGKRTVSRAARREAVARDGMRCSFVSEDGRRCEEMGFLEFDHVVPVALGGDASIDGVRVLCRWHNQYEAERVLGRDVVAAGKAARATDDDLVAGLRRLGVTASDARQAVAKGPSRGPVEDGCAARSVRSRASTPAVAAARAVSGAVTLRADPPPRQRRRNRERPGLPARRPAGWSVRRSTPKDQVSGRR